MTELILKERLQPTLLDRLTDDHPDRRQETAQQRVLTMRELRQKVLRDVSWLFNTTNLEAGTDLSAYPRVASSVLNYGIADLTGRTATSLTAKRIETMIREAILRFEPRIRPESVRVRAVLSPGKSDRNAIAFEVEGDLWGQPVPMHLLLKSEIDLDSGHVSMQDNSGAMVG
ncbi:MAG: type VI secretion system baseplate subunit TssE [Rhodospirillales bacterium]|nr:type VI secretion system baseplate subunit TssE [Rhodospirillales bacterium]